MPLFSYVLGGSTFGLLVRFWQLGLMKRNLFESRPSLSNLFDLKVDIGPVTQTWAAMRSLWSAGAELVLYFSR